MTKEERIELLRHTLDAILGRHINMMSAGLEIIKGTVCPALKLAGVNMDKLASLISRDGGVQGKSFQKLNKLYSNTEKIIEIVVAWQWIRLYSDESDKHLKKRHLEFLNLAKQAMEE